MLALAHSDRLPDIPSGKSKQCVDFIQQCLRRKPDERPTARELTQHPWFKSDPLLWSDNEFQN
jgi:serine/threonine protein kinase